MNVLAADMSKLVLKRTVRADLGEVSLDSEMLQVLMELDGTKNLGQVAQSLNMNLKQLRLILNRLYKLHLCETAKEAVPKLSKSFFHYLSAELSRAMGPIADVVIEDEIREMENVRLNFQPTAPLSWWICWPVRSSGKREKSPSSRPWSENLGK